MTYHSGACNWKRTLPHVRAQSESRHPGIKAVRTRCFFVQLQFRGSSGLEEGWGTSTVPSFARTSSSELEVERPRSSSEGAGATSADRRVFSCFSGDAAILEYPCVYSLGDSERWEIQLGRALTGGCTVFI